MIEAKHYRVLFELGKIACLHASLEKFLDMVERLTTELSEDENTSMTMLKVPESVEELVASNESCFFSRQTLRKVTDEDISRSITMTMPSTLKRTGSTIDDNPPSTLNSPLILDIARYFARNRPYVFQPEANNMTKPVKLQTSSTARAEDQSQALKDRKRAAKLARRRRNLIKLLKLGKPPNAIFPNLPPLPDLTPIGDPPSHGGPESVQVPIGSRE